MRERNALPIGVFDSGLGGLTVVRAIRDLLPAERLIYLGDTARVPYGTRSPETVLRYAKACTKVIVQEGIKALVLACNTVSAVALDWLRAEFDVPVLGVIEPGARTAVSATKTGHVGVLATHRTVASGAYPRAIASLNSRIEIRQQAAPLLVPLIEEGWIEGDVPTLVVRRYLESLLVNTRIDTIVLGCTHYPLLKPLIEKEASTLVKHKVAVVDSATQAAQELADFLRERQLSCPDDARGDLEVRLTDRPAQFAEIAARFLGEHLEPDRIVTTLIDV
ncbi:MAG: glutamate racemase [Sandaracinaceae bacterium]|nr:glutamate racemase [Sandaracinaceae bacterium]